MTRFNQLDRLYTDISTKAATSPDTSYTAKLISQGVEKCAKKFGEEAVELALAAVQSKRDEATKEAADVFYHLFVLLKASGVTPEDVMAELARREGTSGLVEKAARKDG
jgi:phosphoribosyl-ATP pyrophosphohydrolase